MEKGYQSGIYAFTASAATSQLNPDTELTLADCRSLAPIEQTGPLPGCSGRTRPERREETPPTSQDPRAAQGDKEFTGSRSAPDLWGKWYDLLAAKLQVFQSFGKAADAHAHPPRYRCQGKGLAPVTRRPDAPVETRRCGRAPARRGWLP